MRNLIRDCDNNLVLMSAGFSCPAICRTITSPEAKLLLAEPKVLDNSSA